MSKSSVQIEFGPQQNSVRDAIERGLQINKQRADAAKRKIKPIYEQEHATKKPKKAKKTPPVIIQKVVWSQETERSRYEKCEHANNVVIDRDLLTKENHLKLLATPRAQVQNERPIIIQKRLLPATVRINELAQPTKSSLLNTFNKHHHYMSFNRIESFLKNFHKLDHQTPKEAAKIKRLEIKDEKMRQKYCKTEVTQLKDKVYQEKLKAAQKLVERVLGNLKVELLVENKMERVQLNEETEDISDIILKSLCQLMGKIQYLLSIIYFKI